MLGIDDALAVLRRQAERRSITGIARELGVDPGSVSRWVSGERFPTTHRERLVEWAEHQPTPPSSDLAYRAGIDAARRAMLAALAELEADPNADVRAALAADEATPPADARSPRRRRANGA